MLVAMIPDRGRGRLLRPLDAFPLTPLGCLALAAGWLAVREYGRLRQDLILYVAGYGVMALVGLSLLLVSATAIVLRLRWRPPTPSDERVEAGAVVATGFALPSLWWLPFVSLRWQWLAPGGVAVRAVPDHGRLREEVVHGERGEHDRTLRRVVVEDVLGLARVALRLAQPAARTVLPARGRPPTAPLLQALAGGDAVSHPLGPPDGDLVEMRRYVPGDPMKRVLWKTFARTRALMVRLPERAVSPTHRTLAYLVAGDGDEPAAALARVAVEAGTLGSEWRFGADGSTEDARRAVDALLPIVRSRAARAQGGEGFGPFLARNSEFGAGRCVLFTPGRPGPWLALVAAEVRRRPGRVEALVGIDGVRDASRAGLTRWLLRPEEADEGAPLADEVDAVARALLAAGAVVTVIDRPSGRLHGRFARRRAA